MFHTPQCVLAHSCIPRENPVMSIRKDWSEWAGPTGPGENLILQFAELILEAGVPGSGGGAFLHSKVPHPLQGGNVGAPKLCLLCEANILRVHIHRHRVRSSFLGVRWVLPM